jgi:hypothetical protein
MKKAGIVFTTLLLTLLVATASSAQTLSITPSVYNPDNLSGISAEWKGTVATGKPLDRDACKDGKYKNYTDDDGVAFRNQGQCIKYANEQAASAGQYLYLSKEQATSANAAATASISGVNGMTLTELGFDYKGYCGAGAPRFNVYTTQGVYYFFGCSYGTHTSLSDGWTRVRFSSSDAVSSNGAYTFPGFGSAVVTRIDIIQDEGPASVWLDNINVSGTIIGGSK